MIKIDGAMYEGGGAILRTALTMSLITGSSFCINNIRANRTAKGLKKQHVAAIKLAADISKSKYAEVYKGSSYMEFIPGDISSGKYGVDVGSAGSVSLIIQSIFLPILLSQKTVKLELIGGTDVSFSPTIDYIKQVYIPRFSDYGICMLDIKRRGYFPEGKGIVNVHIKGKLLPENIALAKEKIVMIRVYVNASYDLMKSNIVEELERKLRLALGPFCGEYDVPLKFILAYSKAESSDFSVTIVGFCNNQFSLGRCGVGAEFKDADDLVFSVSRDFLDSLYNDMDLDEHATNLFLPYLSIFGDTTYNAKISSHSESIMYVCEKFLDSKVKLDKKNNEIINL